MIHHDMTLRLSLFLKTFRKSVKNQLLTLAHLMVGLLKVNFLFKIIQKKFIFI